jgi:hypothetical protein
MVVRHPDLIKELARERAMELQAMAAHRYRAPVRGAQRDRKVRRWLGIRLVRLGQSLGAPLPESSPAGPCLDAC